VVLAQRPRGTFQSVATDVDRDITADLRGRIQQQARLGAGPAAELDQRRIPGINAAISPATRRSRAVSVRVT
jgi:hypothetical protein